MYKKILYFLSLIPLTLSQTNETDTTQTVIQADYNEHNYIMSQVIINKEFDPDTMTKESDWSSNFELDISNTLSIDSNLVNVIGIWDSKEDDVKDAIIDFIMYGLDNGNGPNEYAESLEDKVDEGLHLDNVNADIYAIKIKDKTVYDKSKWQRAKDYANNKWDTFQNAEMSAPIVTAWVLGCGIPFCICMGYVLYKCKERQNKMVDEGVVTVKLNTVKTTL